MSLISRATKAGPSRLFLVNTSSPIAGAVQYSTSQLLSISNSRSHSTGASDTVKPSHAYIHPSASFPNAPPTPNSKPTSSHSSNAGDGQDGSIFDVPDLTAEEKEVIARIIRVDQAGELGANWIYRGQKLGAGLRGKPKTVKQIEVSYIFYSVQV